MLNTCIHHNIKASDFYEPFSSGFKNLSFFPKIYHKFDNDAVWISHELFRCALVHNFLKNFSHILHLFIFLIIKGIFFLISHYFPKYNCIEFNLLFYLNFLVIIFKINFNCLSVQQINLKISRCHWKFINIKPRQLIVLLVWLLPLPKLFP